MGHDGRVKIGNVEMDGTTGWEVVADDLVGWTATRYGRAAASILAVAARQSVVGGT